MTDARNAPAVVLRIVGSHPEAAVLTRQLDGASYDPDGTVVAVRPAAGAPAATLPDGPLDGRYVVVDDAGSPVGEVLVWVASGLVDTAEYAWFTDDAPSAWPTPDHVHVQ